MQLPAEQLVTVSSARGPVAKAARCLLKAHSPRPRLQVPPEFVPHLGLLKGLGARDAPTPGDLLALLQSLQQRHAAMPLTSPQLRCGLGRRATGGPGAVLLAGLCCSLGSFGGSNALPVHLTHCYCCCCQKRAATSSTLGKPFRTRPAGLSCRAHACAGLWYT